MGKKKTSATPANVSRSTRCKTTRRQRLAARALERDIADVKKQLTELANDPNLVIKTACHSHGCGCHHK